LAALNGATRLLHGESRPAILAEVQDIRTQPWGYPSREIIRFLIRMDYRWFAIAAKGALLPVSCDQNRTMRISWRCRSSALRVFLVSSGRNRTIHLPRSVKQVPLSFFTGTSLVGEISSCASRVPNLKRFGVGSFTTKGPRIDPCQSGNGRVSCSRAVGTDAGERERVYRAVSRSDSENHCVP